MPVPQSLFSSRLAAALAFTLGGMSHLMAAPFTFNKVVSIDTAAPGHNTNFVNFRDGPAVSGGVVVYTGVYVVDGEAQQGIFTGKADGSTPGVVADIGTPAPGHEDVTFNFLKNPVIGGSTIVFDAKYPDTTREISPGNYENGVGVYTATVGTAALSRIVDSSTTATKGAFEGMGAISGNTLAFGEGGGIFTGVVGTEGETPVATITDVPPGETRSYTDIGNAAISGSTVAFGAGALGHNGLFVGTAGQRGVTKILGNDSLTPAGAAFETFEGTAISGDTVAFSALYEGSSQRNEGIYTTAIRSPGAVLVADVNTLVPGLTGYDAGDVFTEFSKVPVIVGNTVVFEGFFPSGGTGIFMWTNGVLTPVITTDDPLFGNTPEEITLGPAGYDGTDITFRYALSNGERGVAVVTVGGSGGTTGATVNFAATVNAVPGDGSGGPGIVTVTRTGDLSKKLVVKYSVKGSAVEGEDFEELRGKVKIKQGKDSAEIAVVPIGGDYSGKRKVKIVLTPSDKFTVEGEPKAKVKLIGH